MARDLNQCSFIGRLGKDIELKYSAGGSAIANFSLACGDDYTDKTTKQKVEKTNWISIVMFGKTAEIAGQYLKKGSQVFIQGKLTVRKWQDQSGQDRYTTEVVANEMQMLGSRGDSPSVRANNANQQGQTQSIQEPIDDGFDDIPF